MVTIRKTGEGYYLASLNGKVEIHDRNTDYPIRKELVEDKKVKQDILTMVIDELTLTREMMMDLLESPVSERRVNHYYSTQLRAEALLPLHREQISLLKQWRRERKKGDTRRSEELLQLLLQSINAIAHAMGTTG